MNVFRTMAESEHELLIGHTQAGLCRTNVGGKSLSRTYRQSADQRKAVLDLFREGSSVSSVNRKFCASRQTVMPVRYGNALRDLDRTSRTETGWHPTPQTAPRRPNAGNVMAANLTRLRPEPRNAGERDAE